VKQPDSPTGSVVLSSIEWFDEGRQAARDESLAKSV